MTDLRESGDLYLEPIEPLDLSPEEFARTVQRHVEERDSNVVLIDGVEGYTMSIQGNEDALDAKLHARIRYLTNMGVTVLLVDEIKEITGPPAHERERELRR